MSSTATRDAPGTPTGRDGIRLLRRDVLVRPALWAAPAAALAVIVSAVLAATGACRAGAVPSAAGGAVLVLAFSGLTGLVMSAVSGARDPRTLLVVALASYVAKLVVFGAAATLGSQIAGFVPLAFALAGAATLVTWLTAETVAVLGSPRLGRQTFGPPPCTRAP